jgi:RNA ligase (TIGR02306 family)
MSQFIVEVVPVKLEKHPDADSLSIAYVKGWQCVVKTSDFEGKSLGAYIPIDSLVPETPEWEFLRDRNFRVKTIKLRKVLSQGLLVPAKEGWVEGQDVTEELEVKKYEPPEPISFGGDNIPNVAGFSYKTDIERIQNFPNVFKNGDPVVITEKVHGTNFRFGVVENVFYVGSHFNIKKHPGGSIYSLVATRCGLEDKVLNKCRSENVITYAEIYGRSVQKLIYGLTTQDFIVFDIQVNGKFLNWDEVESICKELDFKTPPVLYRGPFSLKVIEELADGPTVLGNGCHIREGIVIRSEKEQLDNYVGRKWLKRLSNDYLLKEK